MEVPFLHTGTRGTIVRERTWRFLGGGLPASVTTPAVAAGEATPSVGTMCDVRTAELAALHMTWYGWTRSFDDPC
jgi:hypothetical protein